jgi:hypothetical protein
MFFFFWFLEITQKVAEHVMTEYTRTAIIAYISQPTAGKQEGWGRPGEETTPFNAYLKNPVQRN